MKRVIEGGKSFFIEEKAVTVIGKGIIVIRFNQFCRKEELEEMEKELTEKFGRKVVLLDARFGEILTLPPEKNSWGDSGRP